MEKENLEKILIELADFAVHGSVVSGKNELEFWMGVAFGLTTAIIAVRTGSAEKARDAAPELMIQVIDRAATVAENLQKAQKAPKEGEFFDVDEALAELQRRANDE